MRIHVALVLSVAAALGLVPAADAWTRKWDHSKQFQANELTQLECGGVAQPAECCLCKTIVHEIETQLNNTQNDYEIDVVFRISEEKKKIRYSRSEARILEVLDDVCKSSPFNFPAESRQSKRALSDACISFLGVYENSLTKAFFGQYEPQGEKFCTKKLKVCKAQEVKEEL